ncbi:MAG: DUF262 domain-containing protein [Crocinitomicaceae bacterium]|nr:DUF262 domain-containing protein [Flavobacteriales bacterium]NQZ36925.1 DUF262 domain-containing protein [Crocinitomicaceae bacterium]
MSNNFVTNLLTIEEVVKGRLFKIPDYQRGYSWESEQVNDLLKDIEHISIQKHKHYTGTLVISGSETDLRYDVVDGQQRLTTIIILLREIFRMNAEKYASIEGTFLKRKDGTYVLETNVETNHYFKEAIIGEKKSLTEDIKSLQNLKNSREVIALWLNENAGKLETIYQTVINKLGFLCFAPEESKEIGIMFEVINNRGKALSELEKIKNYFIYFATIHNRSSLQDKVNDNWKHILKYLNDAGVVSNSDENNYLRYCYLVFFSANKKKSWYVYDELKKRYKPDDTDNLDEKVKKIEAFIDFIQEAAKSYAFFKNRSIFENEYHGEFKAEIGYSLKQLRCHPVNASILPLYFSIMHFVYDHPERVAQLLKTLEITNFRIYVLPNPKVSRSDSRQGDLFTWANELFNDNGWNSENNEGEYRTWLGRVIEGNIFDFILQHLEDFTKALCPESVFVQSLTVDNDESIDYYHWNGIRFFLACYEERLNEGRKESWNIEKILIGRGETKKDKLNDYLSKEHIWATQNRTPDFPEDYIDKRRLGNFALLGLSTNIQLQKDDIHNKVKFLMDNNSTSMLQVNDLKKNIDDAWSYVGQELKRKRKNSGFYQCVATRLIDLRETNLVEFALKRWAFEGERMNRFMYIDSFKAHKQNEKYFLKEADPTGSRN